MFKFIPLVFLGVGVFVLTQVAFPFLSFKLWETQNIRQESLLVSPEQNLSEVLGVSVKDEDNFPLLVSEAKRKTEAPYLKFSISIPSLKIENAKVIVDSNELKDGLAQLPGSALPGEKGNVFISGHSALPIAFIGDKNYGSIFANLTKLKKGDEILVSAGGEFRYQVLGLKIVDPKDLSVILAPDGVGRYISLMTCVPPGINTRRLVVLGKLI